MSCHDSACTLFWTAKELLDNGLHDLLASVLTAPITQRQLVQLIASAVLAQSQHVISVAQRLSTDAGQHNADNITRLPTAVNWRTIPLCLTHCVIDRIAYGRSLQCKHGVDEGNMMLSDMPFAFTLAGCGCRHENYLTEHLRLASTLYEQRDQHMDKLQHFLQMTFGGVQEPIHPTQEVARGVWSFQMQCFFAITAVLHCLLGPALDKANVSLPSKEALSTDSNLLFDLISRMPVNVHCITLVSEAASGQEVILRQSKLGYAFFLHGSAVNHSCKPNAIIKYTSTATASDIAVMAHPQAMRSSRAMELCQEQLQHLRMEVIASQSIFRGEEVTISYGPMYPKHPLGQRQRLLKDQYLFACACSACKIEQQVLSQRPPVPSLGGVVEEVKDLVRGIELLHMELPQLSAELSELLQSSRSQGSNQMLYEFEDASLKPIGKKIAQLGSRHYPDQWKAMHQQPQRSNSSSVVLNAQDEAVWLELCNAYCMYLDIHAHLLGSLDLFLPAARMVELAMSIMIAQGMYPARDIVIGREKVKLAGLLLNGGDLIRAREVVADGYGILAAFANPADPDLLEAKKILHFAARTLSK